jgi:hypothetical protein
MQEIENRLETLQNTFISRNQNYRLNEGRRGASGGIRRTEKAGGNSMASEIQGSMAQRG